MHGASHAELRRVLAEIQRRGGIGTTDLDGAIAHAEQFIAALPSLAPDASRDRAGVLVDLGSGGGLPGLVIAVGAPAWTVHLVERRDKRADLLRYGVRTLGITARVSVHAVDATEFGRLEGLIADVVTARSFGLPRAVLSTAAPLVRPGGLVLLSEPPEPRDIGDSGELAGLGYRDLGRQQGVRRLERL